VRALSIVDLTMEVEGADRHTGGGGAAQLHGILAVTHKPQEHRLPLRWIALRFYTGRVSCSPAATTGLISNPDL
jgi:hypothetical protein